MEKRPKNLKLEKDINSSEKNVKNHRQWKSWQKLVAVLSCVVVFGVAYALMLPALTLTNDAHCGQTEHIHVEECYTSGLVCGYDEGEVLSKAEGHVHSQSCYMNTQNLICGFDENNADIEFHEHSEECYVETQELICGLEESNAVSEAHQHSAACYGEGVLTCGKEEHTHEVACYSDKTADMDASVWESKLPKELTGVWADDLVAVAKSQLGYTESDTNFEVDNEGETKGYTIYGDDYGEPYGDWCAMFVSWCLKKAEIPNQVPSNIEEMSEEDAAMASVIVPRDSLCANWISVLYQQKLYHPIRKTQDILDSTDATITDYIPSVGDVVFFSLYMDDKSDHVGIVSELSLKKDQDGQDTNIIEGVKVIEGNASDQVKENTYTIDDKKILGYLELPKNPCHEELVDSSKDALTVDAKTEDAETVILTDIGQNWSDGNYDAIAFTEEDSEFKQTWIRKSRAAVLLASVEDEAVDASKHITAVKIKWKPANGSGEWQELPSADSTVKVPADALLRFEVDYAGLNPEELQASGYKMYYNPGASFTHLQAKGNILVAGQERGIIHVEGNDVVLEFDKDWIDKAADLNNAGGANKQSIKGDFYFQGAMSLDGIEDDGSLSLSLSGINITIYSEKDAMAKHADVDVAKTGAKTLINEDGNWYIDYTLTVTAGEYDIPAVSVLDRVTLGANYVSGYVGVTEEEKTPTISSTADPITGPVEFSDRSTGYDTHTYGRVHLTNETRPSTSGKYAQVNGSYMAWEIGDMKAHEVRTLKYRVKVDESYVGIPHDASNTIRNAATAYLKTYEHGTETLPFSPNASATITKNASNAYTKTVNGVEYQYIDYTVKVSALENNSYPLTNVKVRDDLDYTNYYYRPYIDYLPETIKLYRDERGTQEITDLTQYHNGNPVVSSNAFELYVGTLNPGESRWIKYTMRINDKEAIVQTNGQVSLHNVAEAWPDDTKWTSNRNFGQAQTNARFENKVWERKNVGSQISAAITETIPAGATVLDKSLQTTTNPGNYQIPAGAYKYQVVVNEAGDWEVAKALMHDYIQESGVTGKKYLQFSGYVKIDVCEAVNASTRPYTPIGNIKQTIYVDINNLYDFQFTGEQLGLAEADKDALILTYYAKVAEDVSGFGQMDADNHFALSGNVGPGGIYTLGSGVYSTQRVTAKEQGTVNPVKYPWYYDKNDESFKGYAGRNNTWDPPYRGTGALYWYVEFDGGKFITDYEIEDNTNNANSGNGDQDFIRDNVSLVGFYLVDIDADKHLEDLYPNNAELQAAVERGEIEFFPSENMAYLTCTKHPSRNEVVIRAKFTKPYSIPAGKKVYLVVRTEPKNLPAEATINNYKNGFAYYYPGMSTWNTQIKDLNVAGPNGDLQKTAGGVFVVKNAPKDRIETFKPSNALFNVYQQNTKFYQITSTGEIAKPGVQIDNGNTTSNMLLQNSVLVTGHSVDDIKKVYADKAKYSPSDKSDQFVNYQYENGHYVTWNIAVNIGKEMSGAYTVEDVLPDGLKLEYIRTIKTTDGKGNVYDPAYTFNPRNEYQIGNSMASSISRATGTDDALEDQGFTPNITVSSGMNAHWANTWTDYYTKGQEIRIVLPNVQQQSPITFQVVCKVTDPAINYTDVTFDNTATLYNADGFKIEADSAHMEVLTTALSKEMLAELGGESGTDITNPTLPYTITINDAAEDMDPSSHNISVPLVDHMTSQLNTNMDSMKIYVDTVDEDHMVYSAGTKQSIPLNLGTKNSPQYLYYAVDSADRPLYWQNSRYQFGTDQVTEYPMYTIGSDYDGQIISTDDQVKYKEIVVGTRADQNKITSGKYLLYSVSGNIFLTDQSVTVSSNNRLSGIADANAATVWTITKQADGYTIQNAAGKYLHISGSSSSGLSNDKKTIQLEPSAENSEAVLIKNPDNNLYMNQIGGHTNFGGYNQVDVLGNRFYLIKWDAGESISGIKSYKPGNTYIGQNQTIESGKYYIKNENTQEYITNQTSNNGVLGVTAPDASALWNITYRGEGSRNSQKLYIQDATGRYLKVTNTKAEMVTSAYESTSLWSTKGVTGHVVGTVNVAWLIKDGERYIGSGAENEHTTHRYYPAVVDEYNYAAIPYGENKKMYWSSAATMGTTKTNYPVVKVASSTPTGTDGITWKQIYQEIETKNQIGNIPNTIQRNTDSGEPIYMLNNQATNQSKYVQKKNDKGELLYLKDGQETTEVTDAPVWLGTTQDTGVPLMTSTDIRVSVEQYFDSNGVADGSQVIKFYNLPDNHKIIITYEVSANLSSTSGNSFGNDVSWAGYDVPVRGDASEKDKEFSASANASFIEHGAVKITKYAGEDVSKTLNGAGFSLYRAEYKMHTEGYLYWTDELSQSHPMYASIGNQSIKDSTNRYPAVYQTIDGKSVEFEILRNGQGYIVAYRSKGDTEWIALHEAGEDLEKFHHEFVLDEDTKSVQVYKEQELAYKETGNDDDMEMFGNGVVSYGLSADEGAIHFNKVYAIVETKAPEGYDVDPTPHFFVVPNSQPHVLGGDYFYHADWPDEVHVVTRGINDTLTYFLSVYDYKGSAQVRKEFGGNTELDMDTAKGTYQFGIWEADDIETNGQLDPTKISADNMIKNVAGNPWIGSINYTDKDFGYYKISKGTVQHPTEYTAWRKRAQGWESTTIVYDGTDWISKTWETSTAPLMDANTMSGILPGYEKTYTFADLTFGKSYYIFELSRGGEAVIEDGTVVTMPNGNNFVVDYSSNGVNTSKVTPTRSQGKPVVPVVVATNKQYEASLTKQFVDEGGKLLTQGLEGTYTFVIQKKNTDGTYSRPLQTQTITWEKGDVESSKTVNFKGLEAGADYRIVEVDDKGDVIGQGETGTINRLMFAVSYKATDYDKNSGDVIEKNKSYDITTYDEAVPNVTASNQVLYYSLPHTGGMGTSKFALGGMVLIASAGLLYGFQMSRKRERRLK